MPWDITGNNGTNSKSNFLGTTDNQELVIKTNGTERLRVGNAEDDDVSVTALKAGGGMAVVGPASVGIKLWQTQQGKTQQAEILGVLGTAKEDNAWMSGTVPKDVALVAREGSICLGAGPEAVQPGASPTLKVASRHVSVGVHLSSNNDPSPDQATLRIENRFGSQSTQSFSFNGAAKASIRADSSGNLVLSASSNTIFLSRDFGDTDSITIVPHDSGRTLAVDGRILVKGGGHFNGDVEVDGDVKLTGADCAEHFDIIPSCKADPGTVMVISDDGNLRPSDSPYDKRVAGVVSGAQDLRPAIILGTLGSTGKTNGDRRPIALAGRVYCKADATELPIKIGDLLTTSSTPGHAMAAKDPLKAFGAVIGKALSALEAGRGLIPILIALQ